MEELNPPPIRPFLILMAGLPGTGKSTLARGLAERLNCAIVRSDVIRKELPGEGQRYTPDWDDRTYAECWRQAEALLKEGRPVIVDANFRQERRRRQFLDAADAMKVPALILCCQADEEVIRQRLAGRHSDASDADWAVYQMLAKEWEEFGPMTKGRVRVVSAGGTAGEMLEEAMGVVGAITQTS